MKYTEGRPGRIFVVRLEDGDTVHECLEGLAVEQDIRTAAVIAVGGADKGSRLVVGPEKSRDEFPVRPMNHILQDAAEIVGTGTIFQDEEGRPMLHMHMACGRKNRTVTGCIRQGVKVWHIMEIIILEIHGADARRVLDERLGFKLLEPSGKKSEFPA